MGWKNSHKALVGEDGGTRGALGAGMPEQRGPGGPWPYSLAISASNWGRDGAERSKAVQDLGGKRQYGSAASEEGVV